MRNLYSETVVLRQGLITKRASGTRATRVGW
uniref:Uncharacterized protein n=1 Tax=Arundo donax TaxID=35708 RepID=A0A0A9FJ98_ARUDO